MGVEPEVQINRKLELAPLNPASHATAAPFGAPSAVERGSSKGSRTTTSEQRNSPPNEQGNPSLSLDGWASDTTGSAAADSISATLAGYVRGFVFVNRGCCSAVCEGCLVASAGLYVVARLVERREQVSVKGTYRMMPLFYFNSSLNPYEVRTACNMIVSLPVRAEDPVILVSSRVGPMITSHVYRLTQPRHNLSHLSRTCLTPVVYFSSCMRARPLPLLHSIFGNVRSHLIDKIHPLVQNQSHIDRIVMRCI